MIDRDEEEKRALNQSYLDPTSVSFFAMFILFLMVVYIYLVK